MMRVYTYKGTVAGLAKAMSQYEGEPKLSPFLSQLADITGALCAMAVVFALASL